jgi:hypothetical protein
MSEPSTAKITSPRSKAAKALEEGSIDPETYVAETLAEVRELLSKSDEDQPVPESASGA